MAARRAIVTAARAFSTTTTSRATVLCALYPDPVAGYPPKYARTTIPTITKVSQDTLIPPHRCALRTIAHDVSSPRVVTPQRAPAVR